MLVVKHQDRAGRQHAAEAFDAKQTPEVSALEVVERCRERVLGRHEQCHVLGLVEGRREWELRLLRHVKQLRKIRQLRRVSQRV
ncbi:uncharacterized protein CcaverHIS019_0405700 [Cutaneotrichosporon cavernicola]|uniref:Uncharacterized protein n=1 Tax=Cutaneotrichosporon cavernicola TaxID=279322 RepID=A0AA48L4F3_9TREE|nr:uncharacterized protein CcaverHIS019_0405700 [Cutaneotrichosporon cavernicola]BEI91750.1 hypothetical protein CcaverHIS019_0405700 [Cutaneotrichosporon cavernicola]